jgi:hypothetical protein
MKRDDPYQVNLIYQLHHQFRDGSTEMKSQREFICICSKIFNEDGTFKIGMNMDMVAFSRWAKECQEKYPLPDGAIWMFCNEKSPDFVWAVPGAIHSVDIKVEVKR